MRIRGGGGIEGPRVALLLGGAALSCSYPDYGFVPDDATRDDAARDDAALVDLGSPVEASVDATGIDTTPGTETSVDTTPPPDTPTADTSLGFCASAVPLHVFCNDFDASTTVTFGWTSYDLTSPEGSQLIETTTLSRSAPNVLRTAFNTKALGAFSASSVNRALDAPTAASLTRFEADVMLDAASYPGVEGTLLLKVQRSGGSGFGLGIDPDGLYVEMVGTDYHFHQLTTKVVGGVWFHVRLEGRLMTVGGSTKVWIDDVVAGDYTGESTAKTDGTARSFVVGLYGDAPIATFGARYDNVTVDFVP